MKKFGVILRGCSGSELRRYRTRATADRVRRVMRLWTARGMWTGWRTLGAVCDYAVMHHGWRTARIVDDCVATYRHNREVSA
jgi:hypothetical protein